MITDLLDIYSGTLRPRHIRFASSLEKLCLDSGIKYTKKIYNIPERIINKINSRITGIRAINKNKDYPLIVHHLINKGDQPYIAEYDLPHSINSYKPNLYKKYHSFTKHLLQKNNLRCIVTFSDWAKRSFGLHYGKEVENKCKRLYPLISEPKEIQSPKDRFFDFLFISTNFVIKGGKALVNAFDRYRKINPNCKICIITDLKQAKKLLGSLDKFAGISWVEANLNENQIQAYMLKSKCLIHPTLSDSFGVVVVEAIACGCAIISSSFGSLIEILDPINSISLNPPTSSIVGDTYIQDLGINNSQVDFMQTLSFHNFEDEIFGKIKLYMEGKDQELMAEGSIKLFKKNFSEEVWRNSCLEILSYFK